MPVKYEPMTARTRMSDETTISKKLSMNRVLPTRYSSIKKKMKPVLLTAVEIRNVERPKV